MRHLEKTLVLFALAAIVQVSCGSRSVGGNDKTAGSDDCTVDCDACTVDCDACTVDCAGEPVSLAHDQSSAWFIAVDSTHVYWSNVAGELKKIPLAGGASTLLYDGDLIPEYIALDSTHVYWNDSSHGKLMKSPKVGGTAIEVAAGQPLFKHFIVLDATHVYWIQASGYDPDRLLKVPLSGGIPTVVLELADMDMVTGLIIDATHAYLTCRYSGSIVKVPLDGGASEEIVSGENNPYDLAVDSYRAYWFGDNGSVIKSAPLSGGAPTELAASEFTHQNSSWGTLDFLVIDATHVYWTSHGDGVVVGGSVVGAVSKVPLQGGSPTVLATVNDWPWALAVDSTHVYWTSNFQESYLMKVAK